MSLAETVEKPATTIAALRLEDSAFAAELSRNRAEGRIRLRAVANRFTVRLLAAARGTAYEWEEVGCGDVGADTFAELAAAARKRVLEWAEVTSADPAQTSPDELAFTSISLTMLRAWVKRRDEVTVGRQGEVPPAVMTEVAALAAWRCQFEGCGENLRTHLMPGTRGNYGYFAHIVAASADGPRGDAILSPQLCKEPTNILLLCDKCHRLIDRVAPGQFPTERLRGMRQRSLENIERCLESLRYPVARVLSFGGNVAGQSAAFDERLAEEALWLSGLRRDNQRPDLFFKIGGHLRDPHSLTYWGSVFQLLPAEVIRLQGILNGTSEDSTQGTPLAVFPAVLSTSLLLLGGRLLGEARTIRLFQFHRDQLSAPGGQWAWSGAEPNNDKHRVTTLRRPHPDEREATLLVYLTAHIPASELPPQLYAGGWTHPTVEVTIDSPNRASIAHPKDLELLGRALDEAIQTVQDQWRATKVHLVVIAPLTACVRVGQKMQARCQPDFVVYERLATDGRGAFAPTICITSRNVTHVQSGEVCPLV